MPERQYCVYILSNVSRTLYVGVTNNLYARMHQHKQGLVEGFTSRYHVTMLVYYEATGDVRAAIAREKQLKGWVRRRKVALVEEHNPFWEDLEGLAGCPAQDDGARGCRRLSTRRRTWARR